MVVSSMTNGWPIITMKISFLESDDNESTACVFCGGHSFFVMMGESAVKSQLRGQKHRKTLGVLETNLPHNGGVN